MRFTMRLVFPFIPLILLAACASRDPYTPIASSSLHFCDNNEQMVLSLGDKAKQAAISYNGRTFNLPRVDRDADGEAFSDGVYTLYYDEDKGGVLERDDVPLLTGCFPPKRR